MTAAALVLALHLGVIGFNLFGLIAVPLGAWRGWGFVRIRWWRWLHVAALATVAGQALAGRACFLTLWQNHLAGRPGTQPLIAHLIDRLIYWHLPLAVFAVLYVAVLTYALALLWWVPPARSSAGMHKPPPQADGTGG